MAHLTTHVTGDIIEASHLNDIKSMIDDAVLDMDTFALKVGGVQIIDNDGTVVPVKIKAPDTGGIKIYASDGVTQIALIDEDGNLFIKGSIGQL